MAVLCLTPQFLTLSFAHYSERQDKLFSLHSQQQIRSQLVVNLQNLYTLRPMYQWVNFAHVQASPIHLLTHLWKARVQQLDLDLYIFQCSVLFAEFSVAINLLIKLYAISTPCMAL